LDKSEIAYYLAIKNVFKEKIEDMLWKIDTRTREDMLKGLKKHLPNPVTQANITILVDALCDFLKSFFSDVKFLSGVCHIDDKGIVVDLRINFDPNGSFRNFLEEQNAGTLNLVGSFPRESDYIVAVKYNPKLLLSLYNGWIEPILARSDEKQIVIIREGMDILKSFLKANTSELLG